MFLLVGLRILRLVGLIMSNKILKEITEKIAEKGYPTKNNFWGFNNSISRNKHGEDYIEILCKDTGAIADYIIDLALNQKPKG